MRSSTGTSPGITSTDRKSDVWSSDLGSACGRKLLPHEIPHHDAAPARACRREGACAHPPEPAQGLLRQIARATCGLPILEAHAVGNFYRMRFRITTLHPRELVAEKVHALIHRNQPRDYFDRSQERRVVFRSWKRMRSETFTA